MKYAFDHAIKEIIEHGHAEEALAEVLKYISPVLAGEIVFCFYLDNPLGDDPEGYEDFIRSIRQCQRAQLS